MQGAGGGGGTNDLQVGYAPPPPWYREFEKGPDAREPPAPPTGTYSCFAFPYIASDTPMVPELDSDTKMYVDANPPNYREEFRRLYKIFVEKITLLLSQVSRTGHPGSGNQGSTVKTLIKIYRNLHHLLFLMREWQVRDQTLEKLQAQLDSRQQLLDDIYRAISMTLDVPCPKSQPGQKEDVAVDEMEDTVMETVNTENENQEDEAMAKPGVREECVDAEYEEALLADIRPSGRLLALLPSSLFRMQDDAEAGRDVGMLVVEGMDQNSAVSSPPPL